MILICQLRLYVASYWPTKIEPVLLLSTWFTPQVYSCTLHVHYTAQHHSTVAVRSNSVSQCRRFRYREDRDGCGPGQLSRPPLSRLSPLLHDFSRVQCQSSEGSSARVSHHPGAGPVLGQLTWVGLGSRSPLVLISYVKHNKSVII